MPPKPPVRYRTKEETAAREAQKEGGEAPTPPPSPLVELATNRQLITALQAAGKALAGDEDADYLQVWQVLASVGLPVPPLSQVSSVSALVLGLIQRGWLPAITFTARALPGNIYLRCDPKTKELVGLGIVSSTEREAEGERGYFLDAFSGTTAKRVPISEVDGWLLSPSSCKPCADRSRKAPVAKVEEPAEAAEASSSPAGG